MSTEPEDGRARGRGSALVLDGQSRAAVEVLQSLGRKGIVVDVAAEGTCLAHRSRYCRHQITQPGEGNPDAFLRWLESLWTANGYRLIVPSTETSLRGLLRLPESHALRRAAVLPSTESLEVGLSKEKTWSAARTLGIPVPRSRLLTAEDRDADAESYPLVLKPVLSLVRVGGRFHGLTATIARNREERARALDQLLPLCPVLEQEHVPGWGLGIECLYRDGSRVWSFQHERLHELPLTGGGSSYRRSAPAHERLLSDSSRLLDSLRWHGVAMVEFKGSAETGYRLMEINPRLWGSLALPIGAGVDFPLGLWRVANGEDPGPPPRYRTRFYARNLEMDVDWLKENLRADRSDPLLLTRPRVRSLVEYGRPLLGVERWDHFDLLDIGVWTRVLGRASAKLVRPLASRLERRARAGLLEVRHRKILAKPRGNGTAPPRVLFLCYGNICRSPLAESYARKLWPELEVESAGFHETVDRPPPDWFQAITRDLGVDLSSSRSKRVDAAQVAWAELILLADLENMEMFQREFPGATHKATLLGLFSPTPSPVLEDPYNLEPEEARRAAQGVLAAVEGFVSWSQGKGR